MRRRHACRGRGLPAGVRPFGVAPFGEVLAAGGELEGGAERRAGPARETAGRRADSHLGAPARLGQMGVA